MDLQPDPEYGATNKKSDLRPQVLYPAILEHWLAHNIGDMNNATSHDSVAEFPLRA